MFWIRMFICHPIITTITLWASFMSRFEEPKWIVLVETDGEKITRHPTWRIPTTFETAMRRAKLENFQWIMCCSGKDEGLCVENPEWHIQQA
jgi:hypothetical protein